MQRKYDQQTLGLLWGKSGGICAYPGCKNELIIKNLDEIVGHICHIVGLKGPRADNAFPKDKLNKYENLVLMCRHHHGIIDIDVNTNTIEKLKKVKEDHEQRVRKRMSAGEPWEINVSQLYYLNIPRLSILSEFNGAFIDFSFIEKYENLHAMGFHLAGLLSQYKEAFALIKPKVVDADSITEVKPELTGLTISFTGEFRTKNNPGLDQFTEGKFKMKGDIEKDPQLYQTWLGYKLVLTIDPRWLATTTAFVNFRPPGGKGQFAGIATIKQIDMDNKLVLATPLLIGIPKSPFDDFLRSGSLPF